MALITRTEAEDLLHDAISMILSPEIPPSDIRPAFQKTNQQNPAGRNYLGTEDITQDGIVAFDNLEKFCYFRVRFDETSDEESEIIGNSATMVRYIELVVYCYGQDSSNSALMLKGLMRSPRVQAYLNSNGLYQMEEGRITALEEEINAQWWERNDVTFTFATKETFDLTRKDSITEHYGTAYPTLMVDGEVVMDGEKLRK